MGYADLIARGQAGIPTNIRLLTSGATATYDDIQVPAGTVVRLTNVGANIIRWIFTETLIADGDFEEKRSWEADSSAPFEHGADGVNFRSDFGDERPTYMINDPSLVYSRYSKPAADAQYGLRDMDVALSDASLEIWSHSLDKLWGSSSYSFRFYHQESNASSACDYAVKYINAAGSVLWLDGTGGSFAAAENWIAISGNTSSTQVNELFTTDENAYYSFGFRPTAAHATRRTYLDRLACIRTATAALGNPIFNNTIDKISTPPTYFYTPRGGNLSLIQVTGSSVLEVAEMRAGGVEYQA
jgi:hypothetical protein